MSSSKLYDSLSGILRIQETLGKRMNWGKNPFLFSADTTESLTGFAAESNLGKTVIYTGDNSGSYLKGHIYTVVLQGSAYVLSDITPEADFSDLEISDLINASSKLDASLLSGTISTSSIPSLSADYIKTFSGTNDMIPKISNGGKTLDNGYGVTTALTTSNRSSYLPTEGAVNAALTGKLSTYSDSTSGHVLLSVAGGTSVIASEISIRSTADQPIGNAPTNLLTENVIYEALKTAGIPQLATALEANAFLTEDNEGKCFIYIGETDSTYTRGHMYLVSSDESSSSGTRIHVTYSGSMSNVAGDYDLVDSSATGSSRQWTNGYYTISYGNVGTLDSRWQLTNTSRSTVYFQTGMGQSSVDPVFADWYATGSGTGTMSTAIAEAALSAIDITPSSGSGDGLTIIDNATDANAFVIDANEGKIFIFTGETDSTWTKGHIYKIEKESDADGVFGTASNYTLANGLYTLQNSTATGSSRKWTNSNGYYIFYDGSRWVLDSSQEQLFRLYVSPDVDYPTGDWTVGLGSTGTFSTVAVTATCSAVDITPSTNLSNYYTSSQTDAAITSATSNFIEKITGTDGHLLTVVSNGAAISDGYAVNSAGALGSASNSIPTEKVVSSALDGKMPVIAGGSNNWLPKISSGGSVLLNGYSVKTSGAISNTSTSIPTEAAVSSSLSGKMNTYTASGSGYVMLSVSGGQTVSASTVTINSTTALSNSTTKIPTENIVSSAVNAKLTNAIVTKSAGTNDKLLVVTSNGYAATEASVKVNSGTFTGSSTYVPTESTVSSYVSSNTHSIPSGGSAGQALVKTSGTDYAVEWGNIAAGDIITCTTAAEANAALVETNDGKLIYYTGTTDSSWTYGHLYLIHNVESSELNSFNATGTGTYGTNVSGTYTLQNSASGTSRYWKNENNYYIGYSNSLNAWVLISSSKYSEESGNFAALALADIYASLASTDPIGTSWSAGGKSGVSTFTTSASASLGVTDLMASGSGGASDVIVCADNSAMTAACVGENVGKVCLYIGETNASYTKGHHYLLKSAENLTASSDDSRISGTYEKNGNTHTYNGETYADWVNGNGTILYRNTNGNVCLSGTTSWGTYHGTNMNASNAPTIVSASDWPGVLNGVSLTFYREMQSDLTATFTYTASGAEFVDLDGGGSDQANYYTKTEVDAAIASAGSGYLHTISGTNGHLLTVASNGAAVSDGAVSIHKSGSLTNSSGYVPTENIVSSGLAGKLDTYSDMIGGKVLLSVSGGKQVYPSNYEINSSTAMGSSMTKLPSEYVVKNYVDTNVHSIPSGGTTGQALVKTSNTDYAVEWSNAAGGGLTEISTAADATAFVTSANEGKAFVWTGDTGDTWTKGHIYQVAEQTVVGGLSGTASVETTANGIYTLVDSTATGNARVWTNGTCYIRYGRYSSIAWSVHSSSDSSSANVLFYAWSDPSGSPSWMRQNGSGSFTTAPASAGYGAVDITPAGESSDSDNAVTVASESIIPSGIQVAIVNELPASPSRNVLYFIVEAVEHITLVGSNVSTYDGDYELLSGNNNDSTGIWKHVEQEYYIVWGGASTGSYGWYLRSAPQWPYTEYARLSLASTGNNPTAWSSPVNYNNFTMTYVPAAGADGSSDSGSGESTQSGPHLTITGASGADAKYNGSYYLTSDPSTLTTSSAVWTHSEDSNLTIEYETSTSGSWCAQSASPYEERQISRSYASIDATTEFATPQTKNYNMTVQYFAS